MLVGSFFLRGRRAINKEYFFNSFFKLGFVSFVMNKRGQVTVFIILGIVIVASAIIYFSFRDSISQKVGGFSGADNVKKFVDECLLSVSEEVVYAVGNGGGYVFGPEFSLESGFNYQFLGDKTYFPSLEEIEEEISLYVTVDLISCLGSFERFSNLEIRYGRGEVSTDILNNSVEINLYYPLSVSKGDEVVRYENFEKIVIPVRLGEMYFVMRDLIDGGYYGENGLCVSCMVDVAFDHRFVFDVHSHGEEEIFVLSDLENENVEEAYSFVFVNRRPNEY